MQLPSAIIFVNNDLTDQVKNYLAKQLFISDIMDGYTFDNNVSYDPNFIKNIYIENNRLLVIRSFWELTNRDLADVVIFVKEGMGYIIQNKSGTTGSGQAYQISYINLCDFLPCNDDYHIKNNTVAPLMIVSPN